MDRSKRRWFLIAAATLATAPVAGQAPQRNVPRVGYLMSNSAATGRDVLAAFREGMRGLGWKEGQNIVIETRFAEGEVERLPALAEGLVAAKVDLIVTGSSAATRATRAATSAMPIVMLASADAVGEGLVASLARPGGNITGMTFYAGAEIAIKQLTLLREIAPAASHVAVLTNPRNDSHAAYVAELNAAGRTLGGRLQLVPVTTAGQLENAFAEIARDQATGLLVLTDAMFFGQRRQIAELARRGGLPALYSQREFVDAGGLASYGPSLVDMARRASLHVDKILRGAKPNDIPVEQPTKFELVINSQAAKALGLKIPQSVELRADEVIK